MDWMRGYYAHSGYSYGYYQEAMPARLRVAGLINKHVIPETDFRYLDAGCGQGFHLILAAALHPDSEFVGIDFIPEHIAHARNLAKRCGLDNVTLIEGDFAELAEDPRALGEFDMIVCQGIASWITPQVRHALFRMVGRILRPGGIFYNGYNTQPGWLTMMPFQQLIKMHNAAGDGAKAIATARQMLEQIGQATNRLAETYPRLASRLSDLDALDSAYLCQEFVHDHWQPFFVSEMMEEMSAVKLSYLGPATLTDALESLLPVKVRELVQQQPTQALREQVLDIAMVQNFRRDIYIKGRSTSWDAEVGNALRDTRIVLNPLRGRPAASEPYKITGSTHEMLGDHVAYSRILDRIDSLGDEATIGKAAALEPDPALQRSTLETITVLMHAGWVRPRLTHTNPRGAQIAHAIADEVCRGAPYRHLPAPLTGDGFGLSETDMILIKLVGDAMPRSKFGEALSAIVHQLKRQISMDGRPITDPAEREAVLKPAIDEFFGTKLPYLAKIGIVDTSAREQASSAA